MDRLQTALRDRYAIVGEAGHGGAATVYRARDIRHDRSVAIKVLDPELAAAVGPERFLREIRVTAQLNHPNILTLIDSGEADGFLYYVLPFAEGESLRSVLDHEGRLPVERAVQIAEQIAAALDFAHRRGIVHRDVKPENVLIQEGTAMLSDFGVAMSVAETEGSRLTGTGSSLGTPSYMSPEQLSDSAHVDSRSDIFSLGCLLYEMLAGEPPHAASTLAATAAKTLAALPTPVRVLRDTVPEVVEAAVARALAKTPADRFETAGDFARALRSESAVRHAPFFSLPSTPRRRMLTIVASFTVVGWIILEVVDQLSRRGLAPAGLYDVGLTWFGFGFVASIVIGWFQGEKGRRTVPTPEILILSFLTLGAALASVPVYSRSRATGDPTRATAGSGDLDPRSIAVMYFDDASGERGYLADGLTESLIEQLSRVRGLTVISENGAAQFRGSALRPDSISRILDVGTLVRGRVDAAGDVIRVNLSVFDGASGTEVRRIAVEEPSGEWLEVGDSIGAEMSALLRTWLGDEVRLRREVTETDNAQAWESFQQGERARKEGEAFLERNDVEGLTGAFSRADYLWSQAEAQDPEWLRPTIARAQVALRLAQLSAGDPAEAAEWIATGSEHVARALARDPRNPEGLQVRGTLAYLSWALNLTGGHESADSVFAAALSDLQASVRFDPTLADAWNVLSVVQSQVPNLVEAKLAAQRAYEEDAFLRSADAVLLRLYATSYDLEQFPDAIRFCEEGRRRFPTSSSFVECGLWLLASRAMEPDVETAWRLLDEFEELTPPQFRPYESLKGQMVVGGVIARAGLADSARRVFERSRGDPDVDPARELLGVEAVFRLQMGEPQVALELLRTYLTASPEHREGWRWTSHWWWRDLQENQEFIRLLQEPPPESGSG